MSNTRDKGREYFVTYGLMRCLEAAYANSSPAKRTELQIRVEQTINHFRQSTRSVPTRDRPDKEHALVDEHIERKNLKATASCRKGCAACCRFSVQVTNSEARQLAGLIKSGEVPVDLEKLRRQAAFIGTDYEYGTQPGRESYCVFLGPENECRVYDKRPSNCRKYLVTSDPKLCAEPGGDAQVITSLELESMITGFMDLDKNSDNMAKSILRYLEE